MHPASGLTPEDVELLLDALEAYEYWQLGSVLPRNNGYVFIPGDMPRTRPLLGLRPAANR